MRARKGPHTDAVSVDVQIAPPVGSTLQALRIEHLAAVEAPRLVPFEGFREMVVHAEIEVRHEHDRRLQALGEIERIGAEIEALLRRRWKEHHVSRIAVRGIRGRKQVRLLRARRHAGGWARSLHVHDHRGYLREVRQPQKFLHQRDARARGRGKGTGAVPASADDHSDCGQLILGLHDREPVLATVRVAAQFAGVLLEGLRNRSARRDRIPRAHRGPSPDETERTGRVAINHDSLAHRIRLANAKIERAVEMLEREIPPQLERLHIRADQFLLALVLICNHVRQNVKVHAQEGGQRTDIDDVLEQLPLLRIGVNGLDQRRDRNPEIVDVIALEFARLRARGVVQQPAPRDDISDVPRVGFCIHGNEEIDAISAAEMAGFTDPDLEPRRQALNVRREDVPRCRRNAHAEERLREHAVGGGRAGAVDVRELDHEVVDAKALQLVRRLFDHVHAISSFTCGV